RCHARRVTNWRRSSRLPSARCGIWQRGSSQPPAISRRCSNRLGRRRPITGGDWLPATGRWLLAAEIMHDHLKAFLQFLALNRNAWEHAVRAYESDLTQFLDHLAVASGVKRADLDPARLDRAAIRSFLVELHQRGDSRATAARKLAAVRTFVRFLRREGVLDRDPAALVATPKRDVRMPAHLSEDEMEKL